jgi:hypothetical protein
MSFPKKLLDYPIHPSGRLCWIEQYGEKNPDLVFVRFANGRGEWITKLSLRLTLKLGDSIQ